MSQAPENNFRKRNLGGSKPHRFSSYWTSVEDHFLDQFRPYYVKILVVHIYHVPSSKASIMGPELKLLCSLGHGDQIRMKPVYQARTLGYIWKVASQLFLAAAISHKRFPFLLIFEMCLRCSFGFFLFFFLPPPPL